VGHLSASQETTATAEPEHKPLPTARSVRLGLLLALAGGALDAYTYVGRGGVFANAQTGNVVLLGIGAAQAHWSVALRHIPPILAFIVGVVVAESLKRPRVAAFVRWPARAPLVLEVVVLLGVGLLPRGSADSVATVLVAFTSSVQVSSFRTLVDTSYSTTITTGNLRTASHAAYHALVAHDQEAAHRARRFFAIITAFLLGAFGGALLTSDSVMGIHAVWAPACLLLLALALFVHDERAASAG